MNEFDLYRRVVDDCDEALREAFVKRMNIADKIAEFKLKNNQNITTSQIDEKHIQRIIYDVPVDLRPMAISLWRSLARMNRGRQYSYFNRNANHISLRYDSYISESLDIEIIACNEEVADIVRKLFDKEVCILNDQMSIIESIENGNCHFGIVKTNGFYDTSWVYSAILNKNIYINRFEILEDGSMLMLLGDKLLVDGDKSIITAAFSIIMNQAGDIAQKVSVFSEAGLNIEYLAVKTQDIDVDDKLNMNIVFVELSGASLVDSNVRSAFLQLENECEIFKVIGFRNSVL